METDSLNVTEGDMSMLWTIANQCPALGGIACFKARGMLLILMDSASWDDDSICGYSGARMEIQNALTVLTPSVHLYPNPSDNNVNVSFSNNPEGGILEIYNLVGNLLIKEIIGQNNSISINTGRWNAGSYIVEYTKDKEHWVEKLAVIH